jgi:hypothetical protein
MKKVLIVLLCTISFSCAKVKQFSRLDNRAIVISPVVDLVWDALGSTKAYDKLALGDTDCIRAYQLLFNELVVVVEERGDEVRVIVPHTYYSVGYRSGQLDGRYGNEYWMLKKDICYLRNLPKTVDIELLPKPILCDNREILPSYNAGIVTLVVPCYDSITSQTYSAGTRFVECRELQDSVQVYALKGMQNIKINLPIKSCYRFTGQSLSERKADFLKLIKSWAHQNDGFIPYVYGGASFAVLCKDDVVVKENVGDATLYNRPNYLHQPKSGLDCSCLISRAAQICGLSYFCKDSTTIFRNLKIVNPKDGIENGDIIWFLGHVQVVSDVKNNLLIEARGYGSGYGRVYEAKLKETFAGIENYDQLCQLSWQGKGCRVSDINGSFRFNIKELRILRL